MLEAIVGAGGLKVHFTLCTGLIASVCQNGGRVERSSVQARIKVLMGCIGNHTAFVAPDVRS